MALSGDFTLSYDIIPGQAPMAVIAELVRSRVKLLLKQTGKTQKDFARAMGKSEAWASMYLNTGNRPIKIHELDGLARLFDLTPEALWAALCETAQEKSEKLDQGHTGEPLIRVNVQPSLQTASHAPTPARVVPFDARAELDIVKRAVAKSLLAITTAETQLSKQDRRAVGRPGPRHGARKPRGRAAR